MSRLMHGFPPSTENQVTLANWRSSPFNEWGFHHVREIVPSADIKADYERVLPLPLDLLDLDSFEIKYGEEETIDFEDYLDGSHTDGLVILRNGKIAYEYYANGMTASSPHILMSVSKSILGLLAGIMIERGNMHPEQLVTNFVPEVAETAYKDATIRHLLDMRAGIAFDENYMATSGPIIEYRKSTNWDPLEPGQPPSDLRSFYRKLTVSSGQHNCPIKYVSPNTDLLGWIMERAAGRTYPELISDLIWQPAGAEESAYITVDRLGAPRCAGGMCTTTRDLARIGYLITQNGTLNGNSVIPESWLEDIRSGGDREAWQTGNMEVDFPGLDISYRSQCYSLQGDSPLLFGFGIHGQFLFTDQSNQIVIAKFSSQPLPIDIKQIMLTMQAVKQIVNFIA